MSRNIVCTSTLIALLTFVLDCSLVSAQTVVIPHTDHGWYSEAGLNDPTNLNYFVGDLSGSCTHCPADHRNFFVFDLASVNQPIASAKLALFVPSEPPPGPGYSSPDPSETYELHDIVTSIAALLDGTGGVAAHTDLGSGVVYGSRTMTAADMGSVVEITLNSAAIAALDAATGLIGIGGSLTTLDGLANDEFTFGGTSVFGLETETTELRITLVPEPSTAFLCLAGIGGISLLGRRKAKS
jgi:hypothetical protein